MNEFDQNIMTISDNICKNIASIPDGERGFVSQNILSNLRNLVEAVDQRIFSDVEPIELNCYTDIEKAIKYVASRGNLKFLSRFHDYLQASVSHYTPDEDSSIRLMLKYYEWLLKIRDYCKTVFSLDVLGNLEDYPLQQDESLKEYYDKIACKLKTTRYYIYRNKYSATLEDGTIFANDLEDRIILCLNYDGLYGINNINRFLQSDNPNPPITWDSWIYKVNDPILFNEHNRFYPILYNNLKGWIRDIKKDDYSITFTVEIDMPINGFGAANAGFELLECDNPGHSIIRFTVGKYVDDDSRERKQEQVVPFQVAYAVSIHKAQGLEYDSVKIVVTNEIEELISHNIFYTAITRAKRKLKIYWQPETQQKILSTIEPISNKKDAYIIEAKYGLKILNMVKQVKRTI